MLSGYAPNLVTVTQRRTTHVREGSMAARPLRPFLSLDTPMREAIDHGTTLLHDARELPILALH